MVGFAKTSTFHAVGSLEIPSLNVHSDLVKLKLLSAGAGSEEGNL